MSWFLAVLTIKKLCSRHLKSFISKVFQSFFLYLLKFYVKGWKGGRGIGISKENWEDTCFKRSMPTQVFEDRVCQKNVFCAFFVIVLHGSHRMYHNLLAAINFISQSGKEYGRLCSLLKMFTIQKVQCYGS